MRFDRLAIYALAFVAIYNDPFQKSSSFALVSAEEAQEQQQEAPPPVQEEQQTNEEAEAKITVAEDTFHAPDNAESYKFEAEVSRMLDIVINSLYQNKSIFLRELISNASDALDKIRFLSLTKPNYLQGEDKLQVQIEFDADQNTLTVRDTGIGMTHDELVSNLGTVARSGTTRFLQALQESGEATTSGAISQIGQFGVGFYSSFLVADRVQVASKHPDSPTQYIWTSVNGESEFNVYPDPRGNTLTRGTEITLFLKEDCMEYASEQKLTELAKHYSEFVVHPIYLQTKQTMQVEVDDDEEADKEPKEGEEDLEVSDEDEEEKEEKPKKTKEVTTFEWEHLNASPAIWTRPKEEITDEEYKNFYKIISKDDDLDPERWTHFQAEGNINFKSILYLPQDVPPSWQSGVSEQLPTGLSLYVQKVLISDTFDLLPRYLTFMKGVVDSDDLPLNVNRETLQESKIIQVIKKKIVRKALDLLRNFAKEEDDKQAAQAEDESADEDGTEKPKKVENKYNEWYTKFAPSLKMGAFEDEPNRNKIMKLLRYKSTKAKDADTWVTLENYVKNMKDNQNQIFFVAGPDQATVEKSQFLEHFLEKDIEVLFFIDPIDEYMADKAMTFEGKRFQNIAKEGAKIQDEEDKDLITRREKYYKNKFQPLTKWLKKLYGMNIMRVSISSRLVNSPAIVSSADFGHSANMERIMKAQAYAHGQTDFAMRSMKILEINPRHPLILKLLEGAPPEDAGDDFQVASDVVDAAWMLQEMALLNGGFPLSDTEAHTKRMMRFMQSQLGVETMGLAPEPDLTVMEEEAPEVDFDFDGPKGTSPEDAIPITPDMLQDGTFNIEL